MADMGNMADKPIYYKNSVFDEYNESITIDARGDTDSMMYVAEAEFMTAEGMGYLVFYGFDPDPLKRKVERTLRRLGYTGEVVHV